MSNYKVFLGDNNNKAQYIGQILDDSSVEKLDKEFMAHQAMPSTTYVDIQHDEDIYNKRYTMSHDGYLNIARLSTASNQYILFKRLDSNGHEISSAKFTEPVSGNQVRLLMPVSKGDTIEVVGTADGAVSYFRLILCNGAVS